MKPKRAVNNYYMHVHILHLLHYPLRLSISIGHFVGFSISHFSHRKIAQLPRAAAAAGGLSRAFDVRFELISDVLEPLLGFFQNVSHTLLSHPSFSKTRW